MNNENLRPQNLRTKEEQREIARKGGIASGESRRRSRSMKTILKQMARMDVINEDLKAILESMGVDPTQDVAMAFSIVNEAIRGNVRAFDAYMKYTVPDNDKTGVRRGSRGRIRWGRWQADCRAGTGCRRRLGWL